MKSDNAIFGWVSLNGLLELVKWVQPYLAPFLVLVQIAVGVATFVLLVYKIRAMRKVKAKDVLAE